MKSSSWLVAIALIGLATPASAQSFSNTIFFGDSNTDNGRYFYIPSTVGGTKAKVGPFTTNPDPMWSVLIGQHFGITVTPTVAPGGGNNYAAGGAQVSFQAANSNAWSATAQVAAYLASTGGRADPNALYTMYIGVNDLKGGAGNILGNFPAIQAIALQQANLVTQLSAAGARFILVPNTIVPMTTAAATAGGFTYSPSEIASRNYYDLVTWSTLAANHVNFIPADINGLWNYALLNPAPFGITNTNWNTPACGPTVGSVNCTPANYVTPNADKTYFFADGPASPTGGGHLSGAMQQVEADYYYSIIVAPSEISFLAEAPIQTRLGVVNAIQNQIPLSYSTPGSFHGWVSGDVSWLKVTNSAAGFPNDPGTPLMSTAGFDYAITPDWLVGMAFSGLTTTQSFSLGGNYKQEEFAISIYSAWRHNALWADGILSWGTLHDTVNRQIPLGITVQSNQGTTDGSNVSLAGEVGYNFTNNVGNPLVASGISYKAPPAAPLVLTHGPVAGLIVQQVYINGFTETNQSGAPTALSFGAQTRNSAITELGYQASLKYGIWEPYAKVVWDHEWADLNRSVTASLTSIVAPSFSMPAVILGRDWATAIVGTRVKLGSNLSGYTAFIAEMGQANVMTYGGQIGINYAFNAPVTAKY